jgi:lipopolysaccharide exporter
MLLGRRASATIMGGYTLADEISAMPSTEVLAPLNRVLFPAFVEAKHDLTELKRLYLLAQGVQSLLGISAGAGLALVAHEAVLVLLGEKWLFVVPFVQVLALANVVESITTSGGYVLITMGKIRSAALISWLQVIFFAVTVFLVLPGADALQLALIRIATVLTGLFISVWMLIQTLNNVRVLDIIRTVLRPLLATGAMALAVISIGEAIHLAPLAELIVKIATGLVSFPTAIMLMWWVAGRPSGAESYLLDKALSVLPRHKV